MWTTRTAGKAVVVKYLARLITTLLVLRILLVVTPLITHWILGYLVRTVMSALQSVARLYVWLKIRTVKSLPSSAFHSSLAL